MNQQLEQILIENFVLLFMAVFLWTCGSMALMLWRRKIPGPHFPLIEFSARFDLDHRIRLEAIANIERKQRISSVSFLLDGGNERRIDFVLRNADHFHTAMQSEPAIGDANSDSPRVGLESQNQARSTNFETIGNKFENEKGSFDASSSVAVVGRRCWTWGW